MSDSDLNKLAKQHFLCALKLMNREEKEKLIASFFLEIQARAEKEAWQKRKEKGIKRPQ